MTETSSTPPTVFHALQARDAAALIDYYVETFGFVVTAEYAEEGRGVVHHAELRTPDGAGGLMLGTHQVGPWSREPGAAGAYVVVPEIDGLYDRVVNRGADVVRPLAETDYGSCEFTVRDPEGNLWSFGTYPGEPMPGA
ncbi:VOC family protein [Georgenia deserti]|uniref:VOC family protein n=1 Tax=Georgenia deserti TaxID=2093781 RepID=A0ABW4L9D3_9MICO